MEDKERVSLVLIKIIFSSTINITKEDVLKLILTDTYAKHTVMSSIYLVRLEHI